MEHLFLYTTSRQLQRERRPFAFLEEEYDAILSDYSVGEYGEAMLNPSENRLTVRNRIKAAARRRNVGVDFRRTTGDLLRFQIVEPSENGASTASRKAAVPPEPPPAPVKRKGGRPKKSA